MPTHPAPIVENPVHGRMMRALQMEAQQLLSQLEATGQIIPCVVVNFNPVRLELPQGLVNWKVPRESHYIAPDEAAPKTFAFHYDKREYLPSYIVLRNVVMDKKPEPVRVENGEPKTSYHPVAILPAEQAFLYWDTYNKADRNDMGGVLIFEGTDVSPLMQKSPEAKIRVPAKIASPMGGFVFHFEERLLRDELTRCLNKQKTYYEATYQTAMRLHADPSRQFGTPDDRHRNWAQFGLDMGWRESAPAWMERAVQEGMKKCPACKRPAIDDSAYFCICGAPYDALAAFMAGQEVAEVHLINLPDEQFEKVKEEQERRNRRLQELRSPEESRPKKK